MVEDVAEVDAAAGDVAQAVEGVEEEAAEEGVTLMESAGPVANMAIGHSTARRPPPPPDATWGCLPQLNLPC
jgi:hypothetical protein